MSSLEKTFELSKRGSTVRQEIIAGLTTFLAMVYSVIVVPKMLGDAGIVFAPNGKKYIVVILAKRPHNAYQGKEFIVKASELIYKAMVK